MCVGLCLCTRLEEEDGVLHQSLSCFFEAGSLTEPEPAFSSGAGIQQSPGIPLPTPLGASVTGVFMTTPSFSAGTGT